jgi:hypothetical protein
MAATRGGYGARRVSHLGQYQHIGGALADRQVSGTISCAFDLERPLLPLSELLQSGQSFRQSQVVRRA